MPSYKSLTRGSNVEAFNTCVAHVCVVNEHTIGVLKNRWSCLKELRVQINKKGDMECALLWMLAGAILHNMLISFGDAWEEQVPEDEASDDDLIDEDEDDEDA